MGGGVQTRSVVCTKNDNTTQSDTPCLRLVSDKPITQQACNTQACNECRSQKGSSSRICQKCYISCNSNDCYFVFDRTGGEYWYYWGYRVGVTYNYTTLTTGGYLYTGHDQLWYDNYTWVYKICRRPV